MYTATVSRTVELPNGTHTYTIAVWSVDQEAIQGANEIIDEAIGAERSRIEDIAEYDRKEAEARAAYILAQRATEQAASAAMASYGKRPKRSRRSSLSAAERAEIAKQNREAARAELDRQR